MVRRAVSSAIHVCFLTTLSCSLACAEDKFQYPFYLGLMSGYGATTWQGLVPSIKHQNDALIISTPKSVNEGGAIIGGFIGYEILPVFAIEGAYVRYPNATLAFDSMSFMVFQYKLEELTTRTETVSLMTKIMFMIPQTAVRAFSSAGVAGVHRYDQLTNCWRASPTFGLGVNYNFTPRIMGEIGLSYTGGYGESELNPVEDYVPFLYSAFARLAYRF